MKNALILIALLGLVFAPRGLAHVEVSPVKVPAGSVARIVLRVEGEKTAPTVKVAVQLPSGLSDVRVLSRSGWKGTLEGRVVTWSGGTIAHGQFGRFSLSARFPDSPGAQLRFPTVQTYADGTVVRWIGAPSSEMPAALLTLTAAEQQPPPPPPPPSVTTTATVPRQKDDGTGLTIWLLAAGIVLGLALTLALVWRRRRA